METAIDEFQVCCAALELVRSNDTGFFDESFTRSLYCLAANCKGSGAVGIHTVGRAPGVTVNYLNVLNRNSKDAACDLAPSRLVALTMRRSAGDYFDLAGRKCSDGAVLPAASDILQCAEGT